MPQPRNLRGEAGFLSSFSDLWNSKTTGGYSNHQSFDSWAAYAGDGQDDDHAAFMMQRYNMTRSDVDAFFQEAEAFQPNQCYIEGNSHFGRCINAMFLCDNG